MDISFDKEFPSEDRPIVNEIFNEAHDSNVFKDLPFGYVYRSLYADGHSYVGKRKIYSGSEWMDYVGSGKNLNADKVVRKEFVCFGWTPEELHAKERVFIHREILLAEDRSMVLNIKENVVDSVQVRNYVSAQDLWNRYGALLIDVYCGLGSERKAVDYLSITRNQMRRFLKDFNVPNMKDSWRIEREVERIKADESTQSVYFEAEILKTAVRNVDKYKSQGFSEIKICKGCGIKFDAKGTHKAFHSNDCRESCFKRTAKIKDVDVPEVQRMIDNDDNLSDIAKSYGTSRAYVSSFMQTHGLKYSEDSIHMKRSEAARKREHVIHHVRKNIYDKSCSFCANHIGYEDNDKVPAAERKWPCRNTSCSNTIKGQKRKFCPACKPTYDKINRQFVAHARDHVKRDRRSSYCVFCLEDVFSKMDFDDGKIFHYQERWEELRGKLSSYVKTIKAACTGVRSREIGYLIEYDGLDPSVFRSALIDVSRSRPRLDVDLWRELSIRPVLKSAR